MKYFLNGGGREFDHLLELHRIGWFKENNITTLLLIPLAIKEDSWQRRWVKPMQLFDKTQGPTITSITTYSPRDDAITTILQADAIYFTGGSQETLKRRLIDEMNLLETIKESSQLKAIGGGSAGMMVLGEKAIVGASEIKSVTAGFNFVPKTIFDSHFSKHNRLPRLQSVLALSSGFTGIGIDDNTGVILDDTYAVQQIIGPGTATFITSQGKIDRYDSNTVFDR